MKNSFEVRGEITAIFLKRMDGTVVETIIDTSDLPIAQSFPNTWCTMKSRKGFYVYGSVNRGYKKSRPVLLHRWLMGNPRDFVIDHMNHDTLDNRRSVNLRQLTSAENQQNREGATKVSQSGIRGVNWHKEARKWRARVSVNRKTVELGMF